MKEEKVVVLKWRDKIQEIADRSKEKEIVVESVVKKAEKNKGFLTGFLNKLKLIVYKAIGLQISKLSRIWNSEGTKDIVGILGFVFGYGILGMAVLLTFSDRWVLGYETGLHVFGVGSAVYLFMDLFTFTIKTIKGGRK